MDKLRRKKMDETKDGIVDEEGKSAISADLIRGHINTIILRTLYERDKYGYEIIEEIEKKSHGQYSLKQPTLYSALKRLETQGYINAYWKTDEATAGGAAPRQRLAVKKQPLVYTPGGIPCKIFSSFSGGCGIMKTTCKRAPALFRAIYFE